LAGQGGDLLDFLAAGSPLVFVGFGSMAPGHGQRLGPLITAALRRAGVRGVVQAGWAGLSATGADVLPVGEVPHEWLFPRMAAVVHHAGAGTTAAGLRAGVPTVAVPVLADQPFWAWRLHRLGVAPRPIPFQQLTVEQLAKAINTAISDPGYRHRATALARRINTDDGAGRVASKIDHLTADG
jgi:UDP:flavonoid glycosyltransferase YjiC (YdhE family)